AGVRGWGHLQQDRLGEFERGVARVREIADDEARLARAQIVQARERRLAIVERAERVDHYNDVEGPRQGSQEVRIFDVADEEREIRMRLARRIDHGGAEIYAHAERRSERGEGIGCAASELEHPGAHGSEKLEVEKVFVLNEGAAL